MTAHALHFKDARVPPRKKPVWFQNADERLGRVKLGRQVDFVEQAVDMVVTGVFRHSTAHTDKNQRLFTLFAGASFTVDADIYYRAEPPQWAERLTEAPRGLTELPHKAIKVFPLSSEQQKANRFDPSSTLIAYVLEAVQASGVSGSPAVAAKDLIRNAVIGLFKTLADSVQASGKNPPYPLAEGGKFANAIAKALLFRVPVGVYEGPQFLSLLEREVTTAAKNGLIRGAFWRVIVEDNGSLNLQVDKKQEMVFAEEPSSLAEVMKIA